MADVSYESVLKCQLCDEAYAEQKTLSDPRWNRSLIPLPTLPLALKLLEMPTFVGRFRKDQKIDH